MAENPVQKHCPEDRLSALTAAMGAGESRAMRELDTLVAAYPADARLRFLKGSMLAGAQDYAAARAEMRHAVDLAPDYAIARFQLGLLILTCGEPHAALEAWGPLFSLPRDYYLNVFARGMAHLIRDEFAEAIDLLETGITRNGENAALNRDMQLVIDEARTKVGGSGAVSSVDLLLQQAALKGTRH